MSQEFKLKYNEMKENSLTEKREPENEKYEANSSIRNVCFVMSDGKMQFLNYSYLISGEYIPEEKQITLYFTSHTVLLKGIQMEKLYFELAQHIPRLIEFVEERYNSINEKQTTIVNFISISLSE